MRGAGSSRSSTVARRYRTAGFGYGLSRFLGLLVFPPGFYAATHLTDSTFLQWVGIALSVMVTGSVIEGLGNWRRRRCQRVRDERAATVLAEARRGDTGPYSLYLRGFDTTGRLHQQDTSVSADVAGVSLVPSIDLETALARALERRLPAVGLGRPGEAIGAGRVLSTDSEWRANVAALAEHASLILLMPFPTAGTLWEVELVATHGMLDRCVFVMPPQVRFFGEVRGIAWDDVWTKVREQASGLGVELPRYHPEGALIAPGPSPGTMAMVLGVNSSSPSLVAAQLSRVEARRDDLRHQDAGAGARADVGAHRKALTRLRPALLSMLVKYVVFYGALVGSTLYVADAAPPRLAALVIVFLWGSLWLVTRLHDRMDRRALVGRVGEEAARKALRREVWDGQSAEELKASRGLPDFADLSAGPEGMREIWYYGIRADGTAGTRIVLVDGRVRSWTDPDQL